MMNNAQIYATQGVKYCASMSITGFCNKKKKVNNVMKMLLSI